MDFKYPKSYHLKKKAHLDILFEKGTWVNKNPLKAVFYTDNLDFTNAKFGVSVSKRNFKRAVDRNRIKRLLREAIRSNKDLLVSTIGNKASFMLIYSSDSLPSSSDEINKILLALIDKYKTNC